MEKVQRNMTKQAVQIKFKDAMFFSRDDTGHLCQLTKNAIDEEILSAYGATLKQDNDKNRLIVLCVYHEHNGDEK